MALKLKLTAQTRAMILKAIGYRLFSSLITFGIAFILTGNALVSLSLGVFDVVIKLLSFYYFERLWNKFTRFEPRPAVIWLTGLSGSGKTTIAQQLKRDLNERAVYPVVLDGDEIRRIIKQEGFDEDSRKKHNLNVGFIASLFEQQGSIVIVSLISPYKETRDEIRKMCANFVEVYLSTDVEECIKRDPKGLYKRALAGEIEQFTGISAPYEPPTQPEITLETTNTKLKECSAQIIKHLKNGKR